MRGLSVLVLFGVFLILVPRAVARPHFSWLKIRPQDRTVCGKDEMKLVLDQEAEIKKLGQPIGILRAELSGGSSMTCSGTLVDKDIYLTARHCKASCSKISVKFGFLSKATPSETFRCAEILEAGKNVMNQDYMLLRLEGSPGVQWGYYPMSDRELMEDEPLMIFHHPGGKPLTYSVEDCIRKSSANGLLNHRCDTEPGSSGSGILTRTQNPSEVRVVGVHAFGGCAAKGTSTNTGPSVAYLATISPLVRSLIKD